jgi:hypothetical protein
VGNIIPKGRVLTAYFANLSHISNQLLSNQVPQFILTFGKGKQFLPAKLVLLQVLVGSQGRGRPPILFAVKAGKLDLWLVLAVNGCRF